MEHSMRTKVSLFCDRLIEAGWLAALVVVPLFFNIHSNRVFEPDKLSLLRSIALVMAAAWLVRLVEDWRAGRAREGADKSDVSIWRRLVATPLVLPTLALVVVYLVSTALSVAPRVSLLGSYQRLQGTYTTLSYIVIFFLLLQGLRTKKQLDRIVVTAILVSFPIALYGLIQHFGLDPLPWGGDVQSRAASNMGNAIFVAAYMIMIVPLTIARLLENWKEALGGLTVRDGLLGVVAFVLLAAALLVGMLLPVGQGQEWVRWLALLVGMALQVPIYFLSPPQQRPRVLTISLPLTFAFLVGFSWILEIFFPPLSASYFWLGLVAAILFLLAMAAFAYYLRKPVGRLMLLAAYFIILVAQLACIFYTQSRGPLLGLLAGLFFFLALLGLVKRQVWVPWLMSALAVGVAIFLILFNTVDSPLMDQLRQTRYVGRLGRVLETESGTGRVRVLIWEGATELVDWHPPLVRPGEDGGPDTFNALRPILGYGPESMYVAYNRFYPPELGHFEKRNASPDRSHNETFDALVTTGGVGTLVYLLLFGSVFYHGFRWLGLMRKRWQLWAFIGLLVAGAVLGMVGTWAWRGAAYVGVGIPIGVLFGIAVFILVSLVLATSRSEWRVPPARYQIWILALLAAIVAHFVEIQFGIAIAVTRTYFWIMAATMVVIGTRLVFQDEGGEPAGVPAGTHAAETGAARRRKRNEPSPTPAPRSASLEGRRSLLVLSVLTMLILSTMFFNSITPQEGNPGALATVWQSLTASKDGSSPVILVLILSTWAMIGLVGLAELDLAGDKQEKSGAGWPAALGIFSLISIVGALIFALFHATNLRPVTLSSLEATNPLANTITFYYLAMFFAILAMAAILALFSARFQRAPGWRWSGSAGDLTLAAAIVILPVLLAFLIAASNLSIVRADIVYKQGLSSERAGQWDAAIYLYQEATRLAPNEDFYYLFLGRAAMEKGKESSGEEREIWLRESERALHQAREIAPLNTDHSRNLSKLYLAWGTLTTGEQRAEFFQKALAMSDDAVKLSPNTADIWNERAQVYATMGDYEGALDTYRQSLEQDDAYHQTHLALAQLYTQHEQWDEAIDSLQRVVELSPRLPDAYSLLGYAQSQVQDTQASIENYEKAVELRPQNYLDQKNLAILYNEVGQTQDAIAAATKALAQAPADEKPSLEAFLAQLGAVAPGSTAADPEEIEDLLAAGSAQVQGEDWQGAAESYEQVLALDPGNVIAHSGLAYVYAKMGNLERAITENLAVLDLIPGDYNSHKNLAILYRQAGDVDQAIAHTDQALSLAPESDLEALQIYREQLEEMKTQSSAPAGSGNKAGDLSPSQRNGMYTSQPPMVIDTAKSYRATIVTDKGNIVVELFDDQVPNTVNNFVFLAREGYYDNTTFHRVLPGFMAQAGDPTGTGRGGPGYSFADEFDASLRHDGPGTLSMANAGANTNGSQFFITYEATPWLDGRHAIFGKVVEGMAVLQALTPRDPQQNPTFAGDTILRIEIEEE